MICNLCGVEKDQTVLETYPYPEDPITNSRPIKPLFEVDVDDRLAMICHKCLHELDPDMWIERQHWEAANPTTAYGDLPMAPQR